MLQVTKQKWSVGDEQFADHSDTLSQFSVREQYVSGKLWTDCMGSQSITSLQAYGCWWSVHKASIQCWQYQLHLCVHTDNRQITIHHTISTPITHNTTGLIKFLIINNTATYGSHQQQKKQRQYMLRLTTLQILLSTIHPTQLDHKTMRRTIFNYRMFLRPVRNTVNFTASRYARRYCELTNSMTTAD